MGAKIDRAVGLVLLILGFSMLGEGISQSDRRK